MIRSMFGIAVVLGGLSLSTQGLAQSAVAGASTAPVAIPCTRESLQWAADRYITAQERGDPTVLPLMRDALYIENMSISMFSQSILQEILSIDEHRTLLDVETCQTFTEAIVTDVRHPYVLGVRLAVNGDRIQELEAVVTDENDWLFDADVYLEYFPEEDWNPIPISQRDSRATLIAAANAYFDAFMSGEGGSVPFGVPCNRLEGGIRTGEGGPDDSCELGFPTGMDIHDRRFIVDEAIGAVVGLNRFGEDNLPDTHLFRVEGGKIRYVHTLTVCLIPDCGFVD